MKVGCVTLSGGFLLLIAFLNYMDREGIVRLSLIACTLHELGHLLVLSCMGVRVRGVSLTVVGAEIQLKTPLSYGQELLAAMAGPLVNGILAVCFAQWSLFAGINLLLAGFNLLPVGGLDGGRVLCCALAQVLDQERCFAICRRVEQMVVTVLLISGILLLGVGGSATLTITAGWLFFAVWGKKNGKNSCHLCKKRVK